jgi:hypothetical protein
MSNYSDKIVVTDNRTTISNPDVTQIKTETIVVPDNNTIVSTTEKTNTIVTGPMLIVGSRRIDEISDVDASNKKNGSLLVFNGNTEKWTATTELNLQIVDCGQF